MWKSLAAGAVVDVNRPRDNGALLDWCFRRGCKIIVTQHAIIIKIRRPGIFKYCILKIKPFINGLLKLVLWRNKFYKRGNVANVLGVIAKFEKIGFLLSRANHASDINEIVLDI